MEIQHYFSFKADGGLYEAGDRVRKKIYLLGAKNIYFHISPKTRECKFGFTSDPLNDDKIFLYLATLKDCRVYM